MLDSATPTLFFNASIVHTMATPAAAWCVSDGRFLAAGSLAHAQFLYRSRDG